MDVRITETAWADLLDIARTIREANPKSAESFLDDIYDRCARLGSKPRAVPLLPGGEDTGIRRLVFGNYLAFYRIASAGQVEVLRVIHGARDYEKILFPES